MERGYDHPPQTTGLAATPAAEICNAGMNAFAAFEKQLVFMRKERDDINGTIRELEQRCAELSGMLNKNTPTPGQIR